MSVVDYNSYKAFNKSYPTCCARISPLNKLNSPLKLFLIPHRAIFKQFSKINLLSIKLSGYKSF